MNNDLSADVKPVFLASCKSDTECGVGCCLMVDPGTVPADKLKAASFPVTKSSVCSDFATVFAFPYTPS